MHEWFQVCKFAHALCVLHALRASCVLRAPIGLQRALEIVQSQLAREKKQVTRLQGDWQDTFINHSQDRSVAYTV